MGGLLARVRHEILDRRNPWDSWSLPLQHHGEGAAVEHNVLPGEIAGMGAAQEGTSGPELVRLAEAARRDRAAGTLALIFDRATDLGGSEGEVGPQSLGFEATRQEAIDRHVVACDLA